MTSIEHVEAFPSVVRNRAFDVAWRASSDEFPEPSLIFMVEWAERESGPWNEALDAPVAGATEAEGIGIRSLAESPSGFVRVAAISPSGARLAESPAFTYGPAMSRREFLEYRDALRRERLALEKFTGTRTLVFHRPSLGCPCPECADPVLGGTMDSHCPTCMGTGLVQGYLPPVEMSVDWSADIRGTGTRSVGQTGVDETETRTARILPFPSVASKDLFVMPSTGSVWEVEAVATVSWKVWPVARRVSLKMLPKGDPASKLIERGIR